MQPDRKPDHEPDGDRHAERNHDFPGRNLQRARHTVGLEYSMQAGKNDGRRAQENLVDEKPSCNLPGDEEKQDDAEPRGAGPRQEPFLGALPTSAVRSRGVCLRRHGRLALASRVDTTMLRMSAIATAKAI